MTSNKQYLLREYFKLCDGGVCQDFLTEAEKREIKDAGAMYLTGIAQRADYRNGNGRIYPEKTLRREVENYKKFIKERRSIGECVDEETEIFTTNGWKYIKDINENEEIFTLNQSNNQLEKEIILKKVVLPFKGKIYNFKNKKSTIDMKLTPNHNMIIVDRNEKYKKISAENAFFLWKEKNSSFSHSSLKKIGINWNPTSSSFFVLPGDTRDINIEAFSALIGIFLAEGCCLSKQKGNNISITQKKENIVEEIRNLLNILPFKYSEVKDKNNKYTFYICDKYLKDYVKPLGKSYEKYIPKEIKEFETKNLNILLNWFLKGDGRNRFNNNKTQILREAYTTSKKLAEDIFEIFLKLGTSAHIQVRIQNDRLINDRIIKKENSRPLFIVSENLTNQSLDFRFLDIKEEEYEGKVYCVTTKNGNWLMRRNNCITWTHNCDHPEETVISLMNASHIITDIWWQGKDVMIKLKVLSGAPGQQLRSLVNDGVAIGLSSRGLGSVRETNGSLLVEDDFHLICFDVVSEPSTGGAFMQLIEAKMPLVKEFQTKTEKVNNLINEILMRK